MVLKKFLKGILYLNIYILFLGPVLGQTISLKLNTEKELSAGLLDTIGAPFSFDSYQELEKATETIKERFQKIGYLEVRKDSVKAVNDSVYEVSYRLGNKWSYLKIRSIPETVNPSLLISLGASRAENGTNYLLPIASTEYVLSNLTQTLSEDTGDPFIKVFLRDISREDLTTISAILLIESQKPRTVDGIVVKGYEKFPKSFIKYYAGVKKGRPFRQQKINAQNDLLDNLAFATSIKPPEALFKKDSTVVYFYLQKKNSNNFDGILGFATNEDTQKLEFNGYLNLALNNNLNFGERLLLNYKADGNDQQNFRAQLELPYLFKSPFGISLELKIFKRDSTFSTTEQKAKLNYQLSPRLRFYGGYKSYESSNLLETAIAGVPIEDFNSDFFVAGAEFSIQQKSSLFPTKTFASFDAEFGKRTLMATEDNQIRMGFSANHIFNLNPRNSIYLNNNTQYLSSNTYVANELFRFGGINSIRGFNENSIDASLYTLLNTEYRFVINNQFYLHTITDLGYFENNVTNLEEELYSFGFGVGLLNDAGLFRLNIANGTLKSQTFQFANTKVHISYSTQF